MSDDVLRVDLVKRYPSLALHVTFETGPGTLVLFGPSGSGKTTILAAIAGLVQPDGGEIELRGRPLYRDRTRGRAVNLPARERRIGYVFQEYALFPHMTVLDNVAFPIRGVPREARQARARELIELVHMSRYAAAHPDELSGGQRQRVAIARALALDSGVLLLDEPFTALDDPLRHRLQDEIRTLQQELGLIVVLVTHTLEDAFAMGDRIAVLHEGRVEQLGAVDEVFRRPATSHVAEAMGIRNLIRGRACVIGGRPHLDWSGILLETEADERLRDGADVIAYVRPEDVKIVYPDRPVSDAVSRNLVHGTIVSHRQISAARLLQVRLPNDALLEVRFPLLSYSPLPLAVGNGVAVAIRREGLVLLDVMPPGRPRAD
jgi:molybdate transport system ATP-binding protein